MEFSDIWLELKAILNEDNTYSLVSADLASHPVLTWNGKRFITFLNSHQEDNGIYFDAWVIEKVFGSLVYHQGNFDFIFADTGERKKLNKLLLDELFQKIIIDYYEMEEIYQGRQTH